MRTIILWLGVAASGAGFFLGQRHDRAELSALHEKVAALSEAAREREARPAAALLQRILGAPAQAPALAPTPAAVAAVAATPRPASTVPPAPSEEEVAAAAADHFAQQAVEPAWARTTEAGLRDGFAGRGLDGRMLRSLQCRQRTCRLEVAPASEEERRRFLEEAMNAGPDALWPGAIRVVAGDDLGEGRATLLAYLDRE